MITRVILLGLTVLAIAACQPGSGNSGYAYSYSASDDDNGGDY